MYFRTFAYRSLLVAGFVFGLILFVAPEEASAQRRGGTPATPRLEELPRRPMDTIPTADPETKVIIFSNNTWEYYRPELRRLDNLSVFREHWDTASVFSYRNIELGDEARILTKPQLEIYADDVKCSHGATVGQLDGEAILYMRQRGLSDRQARRLQIEGFAADVAGRCAVGELAEPLLEAVAAQLEKM